MSLGVRTGRLSLRDAQGALSDYRSDRVQGGYHLLAIDTNHFIAAERYIAFGHTLRAGDSLHLGIALVENCTFVTGDADLARIARALGLVTVYVA